MDSTTLMAQVEYLPQLNDIDAYSLYTRPLNRSRMDDANEGFALPLSCS